MANQEIHNMTLLSQDTLVGFGGMGEGMAMQVAPDGRRIMWLAHESAPKNFTGVDVSDPRNPKVICQTDLPVMEMRSNSLEVTGDNAPARSLYRTFGFDIPEGDVPDGAVLYGKCPLG